MLSTYVAVMVGCFCVAAWSHGKVIAASLKKATCSGVGGDEDEGSTTSSSIGKDAETLGCSVVAMRGKAATSTDGACGAGQTMDLESYRDGTCHVLFFPVRLSSRVSVHTWPTLACSTLACSTPMSIADTQASGSRPFPSELCVLEAGC